MTALIAYLDIFRLSFSQVCADEWTFNAHRPTCPYSGLSPVCGKIMQITTNGCVWVADRAPKSATYTF